MLDDKTSTKSLKQHQFRNKLQLTPYIKRHCYGQCQASYANTESHF